MRFFLIVIVSALLCGCPDSGESVQVANTGVKQTKADIETGSDGLTVEQRNVKKRLTMDNTPGSVKHLYVISAMSGQIILYSTVKGKVTSSGKRLTPTSVAAGAASAGSYPDFYGVQTSINGNVYRTSEVMQDDGTFGSSIPYIFWFDVNGRYHQHYVSGGQIIHVSDHPIRAAQITLNLETSQGPGKYLEETK